jgi:hypothetical protein
MKIKLLIITSLVCLFFFQINVNAQVKTKIYFTGVPQTKISKLLTNDKVVKITAPSTFETLLNNKQASENKNEYKNKFAESVKVEIDFIKTASREEQNGNIIYSLTLNAEHALNISAQFSKFILSKNSLLSIFTSNEITDSITAKENNSKSIWATRVYQGELLHIVLITPKEEEGQSALKVNQIGFGFLQIGGEFFGKPGASATCNINVLCAQGNGWQDERNSVALIVSNSSEICTGTLVMNTCGTNIPYLLTANHCLGSDVQNWVFQFQTWSTTCTTNGTFREDVQFNGCQLRANNSATDFALVELNQIPQPNSGITYSGWSRTTTPATSSTCIHHPMGDLMKISTSNAQAISVPWVSGASNHWRVNFNQGIVQHGSSGAALFDQNHRIVGQLHGNQVNQCSPGQNNCWCVTQIPSIGEYGRFDISWTGGGTNSTRLSNWLDPNSFGVATTNTTNINNLAAVNAVFNQIAGPDNFCNTASYSIQSLPANGYTVTWQILQATNIVSSSVAGNTLNLTKLTDGYIEITATITNAAGCSTTPTQYASKKIIIGSGTTGWFWLHGQNFDYTATGPGNYYSVCPNEYLWFEPYYGNSTFVPSAHIWTISGNYTLLSQLNEPTLSVQASPNVRDAFQITYQYFSPCGGWSNIAYGGAGVMNCAGGEEPYRNGNLSGTDIKVYPNPTNNYLYVRLTNPTKKGVITLFDITGKTVLIENFSGLQKAINISSQKSGTYILRLQIDGVISSTKVIIGK